MRFFLSLKHNMALFDLKEVQEIKNIEFLAKQVVEGFIVGMHQSPFHGFSVEFAEHRLYNPGESTKNIDWKVYARTDKLFTKRFNEETNLRCYIALDASSSMYYPSKKNIVNKLNFSVLSAASFIELFKRQRDATSLAIFSNKVELLTKAKSNAVHTKMLYSYLEKLIQKEQLNKKTKVASSLHRIAEEAHRRSLIIIFSDMLQNNESEDIFNALQHLKFKKHEIILFHVVDRTHEIDFKFDNKPYQFIDMESGNSVKLHANQVRDQYTKQMYFLEKELFLKCAQYNIDFIPVDIQKSFHQILTPYLLKRKRLQ